MQRRFDRRLANPAKTGRSHCDAKLAGREIRLKPVVNSFGKTRTNSTFSGQCIDAESA